MPPSARTGHPSAPASHRPGGSPGPAAHAPKAHPEAIVIAGDARFTILTPALIRMEYIPGSGGKAAAFEDRASQAFIRRDLKIPEFTHSIDNGWLTIKTAELTLRWRIGQGSSGAFSPDNLSIRFRLNDREVTWHPGMDNPGNLRGTTRTLDGVSGSCPLEPGLLSRDGWALVDDSATPLFDGSDWDWMAPRPDPERNLDWYFFAYGRDYTRLLRDYTRISGSIPLPPIYIFGSWWSRYWPYTDDEFKALVAEFDEHHVPLDILVLDMDWHLTGWTGYTWDPQYFPDPQAFLAWCREKGLRTTLNLHPADGVGKHESQFRAMASAVKAKRSDYRIHFDCTSKPYMRAYFDILHRPLEAMGVDFWWMDWQQGTETKITGLDPLWWLNHLHWEDMQTNPARIENRPIIFSRWGGLGNHRYPIGFSGDTYNDWPSLAFQPYFTATAANVGYAYWSHDIGGHQPGPVEDELYARWIQFGIFSPVLRTHCGRNPAAERRIWKFRDDAYRAMKDAFHWRYRMLPYLYTACRRTYDEAIPLCRPLYYDWPEEDDAYTFQHQYLFGEDLLVAPIVEPSNESSGLACTDVWFPPGSDWIDWFTGHRHTGGTRARLLYAIDEIPVFARAGSIIPHGPDMMRTGEKPLDPLTLHVFPGDSGSTRLYEDDGLTDGYRSGACAWTTIEQTTTGTDTQVVIHPAEGSFDGMVTERAIEVRLRDAWPPSEVRIDGEPVERLAGPAVTGQAGWWYDERELSICIRSARKSVREQTEFTIRRALPHEADAPLRAGLRGQLALLDSIAAQLGIDAPDPVTQPLAVRSEAARNPEQATQWAQRLQDGWWSLVEAVNGSSSAHRGRALAKLLGLIVHLDVVADDAGALRAIAEIDFAPRFSAPHSVTASISLHASGAWKLGDPTTETAAPRTIGAQQEISAPITPTGQAPATGEIELRIHIESGDIRFPLSTSRTFCPSINAWAICGPFEAPFDEDQLETDLGPESAFTPQHPKLPKLAQKWKLWHRPATLNPQQEFMVDLQKVFGAPSDEPIENAFCYAACLIESPDDRDAVLVFGSDDSITIDLNAQRVFKHHIQRGYRPREERQPIRLRKGTNTLLLKVGNALQGWSFGMHIETSDARPMTDLVLSTPSLP